MGVFLLSSDANLSMRAGASVQFSFGTGAEQDDVPVTALVRNLVDTLQINRGTFPRSVGEKVQVQWGSGSYYYPSTVSEIKENQYRIRYENDPQGRWDEWVGIGRIKSDGLARCYRVAQRLFILVFALAGGVIGVYFFATSSRSERAAESNRKSAT
jgi:hypothetical protein